MASEALINRRLAKIRFLSVSSSPASRPAAPARLWLLLALSFHLLIQLLDQLPQLPAQAQQLVPPVPP
jgi:hypothetical protein